MDFVKITKHEGVTKQKKGIHVVPDFKYANVKDLVCKGGGMYAFWDEGRWNTNIDDLVVSVDRAIYEKVQELKVKHPDTPIYGKYMDNNSSNMMNTFDNYTKLRKQSEQPFNKKIIFSNETPKREDFATTQLDYYPQEGPAPAFDELLGTLYSQEELDKILWCVGALFTNNMSQIQKFMYLYGGKGSGKGTVINILKELFKGYYSSVNLLQITGGSEFATGQIKEVPLLVDEDSDISRIKNDTYLLKLTSHEPIPINAKYKQTYDLTFNGLLVTASNQRFQVRNIDSGITRRALVVKPTGKKHSGPRYNILMDRIKYELPMIAQKAIDLFEERGPYYYDNYMDVDMAEATDHVFSFVREYFVTLGDPCTLKKAAELYKVYLEEIEFDTRGYKRKIKNELGRYYENFHKEIRIDGEKLYNVFEGFKHDLAFPDTDTPALALELSPDPLSELDGKVSTFDKIAESYPAQLATSQGTPKEAWDNCTTTLKDIDTSELHYVRVPLNHIVIDFDMVDEDGNKDLAKNLIASKRFPKTYTELSKSGQGVHLHYIYDGDVAQLAKLYEDDVEIKVFTGKQSLRRKLTKFNELPISHITTGLPKKEKDGATVYKDVEIISWNEKKIRTTVKGNLEKKYHGATKPSMDFIAHILEQAEKEGVKYDIRDLRPDIIVFAGSSTNNSAYCLKVANNLNYNTIDDVKDTMEIQSNTVIYDDKDIYFYDLEVFPNLLVVAYKRYGDDEVVTMINPSSEVIEKMLGYPLIGFNNRRYDNHIMYARLLGEDNLSIYRQSQRIIGGDGPSGMYSGAYELSYADIYEYASKKQSLKKWEIDLNIKHDEMELPWDQPVPEELWDRVAEYCGNDVIATEEVFKATYYDYTARKILSTLSGLKMNATTTQHAAAFLFGKDPNPQSKFVYEDLSKTFPGYSYSFGKSDYKGEDPSEGGYVYSEPGIYEDVDLFDVASMHPNSLIQMNYFGPYTQRYADLVQTRIHIKHDELEEAGQMFGGILKPFLSDKETAKQLSYALKIIINIVYGMTSASFDNKFKHPKNVDNVVAKRGALFMMELKLQVQAKGFTVVHVKTDSIKVHKATPELIDFIFEFGKKYGYDFEHEANYEKFALINKADYVARESGEWQVIGARFAEPYVFKTLFSGEPVVEADLMMFKQATAPIYIGETFVGKVAEVYASKTGQDLMRKTEEKESHISGTKNYGWRLRSDYQGKEDIDMRYYDGLVESAVKALSKVGDPNIVIDPFLYNVEDPEVKALPF